METITDTLRKTCVHLLQYLNAFLLQYNIFFRKKGVEKIRTNISCSITFAQKSCLLRDIVGKYGKTGQVTDSITWHMRFVS